MKSTFAPALWLAAFAAAPAIAQTPSAPAAAADAPTIDTPIAVLMASEATRAVLVKHLGPLGEHPSYEQFKTMSLVQLQPWSAGQITDEALAKIKADLAAL
ncbi:hypothetical protein [Erythrobacter sp.]|jgi:hypothetical protein|uniref:hypothetical protein n=1 Tax=Erythrobacter sp. TaxID=1042 RepID=UPI002EA0E803|nr:hypothetical protein [Erythrobacter sp.]